jgi:integrase
MASLQVRHTRGCALGRPWTPVARMDGCDCEAVYNVVTYVNGKPIREKVGTDRGQAEARLARVDIHIAEDTYEAPVHETFQKFSARWLEGLRGRSTTVDSYRTTIAYARAVFGRKQLSKLGVADVTKLMEHIERENGGHVSEATLAKHLRQLSACLEAARREGLVKVNPVGQLDRSRRPTIGRKRPSYFTDDELTRLWPELADRPVYLTLCKLAATTGLRFGELAGLRWPDVALLQGELEVRRQFTHGAEVDRTKDAEPRTVHLVPAARALLEAWWNETGDEGLVFENEDGGFLDDSRTRKVLYAAMKRAGIPREGRSGRSRTFHSLRHTFARSALEHGAAIQWVKDELGHSTITLTVDLYGAWSQEAAKDAADRLEGAFAV